MLGQRIQLILVAASLFSIGWVVAQPPAADELTRQLFDTYLARPTKMDTESILAATHLVAERGRRSGFWQQVLTELKRNNEQSEVGCVRVLGKMLAFDAAARDSLRRQKESGELPAVIQSVYLSPEVVTELVDRGRKADRFLIDHYAIALARARTPEARGFFQSILQARAPSKSTASVPTSTYHLDSTKFHAAVGLAQLGEPEGVDWLIQNCEFSQGTVTSACPKGTAPGGNLSACCVEALRHLSDRRDLTTKAEWTEWSKSVDHCTLVNHAVVFSDP